MKKFALLSLIAALVSNAAVADVYRETVRSCDEYEMRAALDRASAEKRAVITIVECDKVRTVAKPVQKTVKPCGCGCNKPESVVKREYFVRETVQQYEPVVMFVPTTTYTRVKPVCNNGCF